MGGRRFDAKKGKDLRTYKLDEIKKSLTHRARLRKNYFKLLKNEDPKRYEEELKKEQQASDDQGDEANENTNNRDKSAYKKKNSRVEEHSDHKRLSFAEKAKIIKERKEEKRKRAIEEIAEKKRMIEKANRDRERKKERISKRTKSGQPLMGPRINNLLDKIKNEMN